MTQQIGNAAIAMVQAAALQMEPAKAPAKEGGEDSFRKMLERKSQSAKPDGQEKGQPKAEEPETVERPEGPVQEDAQAMAKRLAQLGLVVVDPSVAIVPQAEPEIVDVGEAQEGVLQAVSLEEVPEGQVVTAEFAQGGPVQVVQGPMQGEVQSQQPDQERTVQPQQEAAVQPKQAVETQEPLEEAPEAVRTKEEPVRAEGEPETELEAADSVQVSEPVFRDVEAAPVKVGETYRAEDSQQVDRPDVAGQIDSKLSQALERGESYVRIQLDPESLGSVTVEISRSADGVLRVALSAHSSETRELLQRHSAELQGLLSDRGQQDVQVEVQRQQESQQGQGQHPYDGHNGQAQDQDQGGRQQQRRQEHSSQDFIQQLRLGLIPAEVEEI